MGTTRGFVVGLVGLVGLAGCGSPGVQVSPRYMSSYTTDDVRYAAKEGLRAEIVGNPFAPEARSELEAVITESIARNHFGPTLPVFTDDVPADFISPYRVVMVLNPTSRSYPLCENTPESGPADGTVYIAAAFCASGRSLTEVKGSATDVQGPDDARFRELISTMTVELFPPFDERDDNEPDADFDLN